MAPEVIDIWDACLRNEITSHELVLQENFETKHNLRGYDYSCDLYSLGVLIWELVQGRPPYGYLQAKTSKEDKLEYFEKIWSPLPEYEKITKGTSRFHFMDLASKLMAKKPEERLGYGWNWAEIKSHPAFDEIGYWDKFNPSDIVSELPETDDISDILDFISTSGEFNLSDADESEKLTKDQ